MYILEVDKLEIVYTYISCINVGANIPMVFLVKGPILFLNPLKYKKYSIVIPFPYKYCQQRLAALRDRHFQSC